MQTMILSIDLEDVKLLRHLMSIDGLEYLRKHTIRLHPQSRCDSTARIN